MQAHFNLSDYDEEGYCTLRLFVDYRLFELALHHTRIDALLDQCLATGSGYYPVMIADACPSLNPTVVGLICKYLKYDWKWGWLG